MAKSLMFAFSAASKLLSSSSTKLLGSSKSTEIVKQFGFRYSSGLGTMSRAHGAMISLTRPIKLFQCPACTANNIVRYSTEVDKEISKFLEKEIKFENSRSSDKLPTIPGFDIKVDGANVTFIKTIGAEKIVVKLSVNGAVDALEPDGGSDTQNEPPQMVCRPPFDVEIIKGNTVLALQCSFPTHDTDFEEGSQYRKDAPGNEPIDDQFEIQEVALHAGEWKDTTFSVSAATMDAELFDLLMDMLDERGINDEFISQLVDYCTAYENKQYLSFLLNLKTFAEK